MTSILLIDDDFLVRTSIGFQLELEGHEVVLAADGADGLAAFEAGSFDVVITDILMPGIEGIETVRRLRQMDRSVVIIAMTGGAGAGRHDGTAARGLDYLRIVRQFGATATLRKPFTGSALLALITETLRPVTAETQTAPAPIS